MTKVICFVNNKGGSGKSTTCSSVGYALASLGQRVLLLDCDGQMNLTLSITSEEEALALASGKQNLYEAMRQSLSPLDVIVKTDYEGLDLLAASPKLARMEEELCGAYEKHYVLRKYLERIKRETTYDAILVDTPPMLGEWVMNVMCGSDGLVVPVEASPWGLFGLANMLDYYGRALELHSELDFLGVVVTKADNRKTYCKQTVETLRELPDVRVFDTIIHVDSHVEWAQEHSRPVGAYAKSCRAAKEYVSLAKEIMEYAGW